MYSEITLGIIINRMGTLVKQVSGKGKRKGNEYTYPHIIGMRTVGKILKAIRESNTSSNDFRGYADYLNSIIPKKYLYRKISGFQHTSAERNEKAGTFENNQSTVRRPDVNYLLILSEFCDYPASELVAVQCGTMHTELLSYPHTLSGLLGDAIFEFDRPYAEKLQEGIILKGSLEALIKRTKLSDKELFTASFSELLKTAVIEYKGEIKTAPMDLFIMIDKGIAEIGFDTFVEFSEELSASRLLEIIKRQHFPTDDELISISSTMIELLEDSIYTVEYLKSLSTGWEHHNNSPVKTKNHCD